jgi:hypothetical protein
MPPFVLVHGGNISTDTWNRLAKRTVYPPGGLLGPHCWDGTVSFLEAHGHPSFAPALGDEKNHAPQREVEHIRIPARVGSIDILISTFTYR